MATFEGLKYITPITINSRERIFRSETINLKVQAVGNGAQRWDLVITLAPASAIGGNAAGAALGVHRSVNGFTSNFDMEMPQYLNVPEPPNAITVVGSHTTGTTITVESSTPTPVAAGRFISFGTHNKVYQVRSAVTVDDTGTETLEIFPALVNDLSDGDVVNRSPNINVFYAQDGVEGITYTEGVLTRATINVVEALV